MPNQEHSREDGIPRKDHEEKGRPPASASPAGLSDRNGPSDPDAKRRR